MNKEEILAFATNFIMTYGLKIIGALMVWIVGWWVIKLLNIGFGKMLDPQKVNEFYMHLRQP